MRIRIILNMLLYLAAMTGYLPLAPFLQPLPKIALPAAIIFAAFADRRGAELKGRAALLVSMAAFIFYFLQFSRHNLIEPTTNMLVIFLAIRIAGEKSARNVMQALTLALFCLAASTLFDLSPGFVLYLIILLLTFTVCMVLLTFESRAAGFTPDKKELRSIVSVALLHPLVAAPLVLFLFFILPRTQLPLWSGLSQVGAGKSGISETIKAGEISSISGGAAVVFRAEMPKQPENSLYWRAIVLNTVKGEEWFRQTPPEGKTIVRDGVELPLTIFLEPGQFLYLPTLNIPEKIADYRGSPQNDRIFPSSGLSRGRRSYQVLARTGARISTSESIQKKFYATIPGNTPLRLKKLVDRTIAGLKNDQKKLDSIENLFAGMNLSYAATGLPTGTDAVEKFLFDGKKGHCELFAISFASALRLAGLPARLVGGYYGGDYNEMAGYYIITEKKAHVWVEIWLNGKGWVSVDPSRFAVNFDESFSGKHPGFNLRLKLFLDSLSYYWNRLVINYDFENQLNAVSRAGAELKGLKGVKISGRKIAETIAWLALVSGGIVLLRIKRISPEERLLKRFKRAVLVKYGIEIPSTSGLHEAVRAIDETEVQEFVDLYSEVIYRDKKLTGKEREVLGRLLKDIKSG